MTKSPTHLWIPRPKSLRQPSGTLSPMSSDPRQAAGAAAERQMVHYLRREFSDNHPLRIIQNLRLLDPTTTEADGSPAAAQIDHLVIHRSGAFIIESKSVSTAVRIRDDGSGGDEWERLWDRRWQGMPSPIQQAERQGMILRTVLNANREQLLSRLTGARGIASKLLGKSDQKSFRMMPIQIIVAISDQGTINRDKKWQPPTEPFQTFVTKADLVVSKIRNEIARHDQASGLLSKEDGDYGIWRMDLGEVIAVRDFLVGANHPLHSSRTAVLSAAPPRAAPKVELKPPPPPTQMVHQPGKTAPTATCHACSSTRLTALYGQYGYFWKCAECNKTTTMGRTCSLCSANSDRGRTVRVSKDGPVYTASCKACGKSAVVWNVDRDEATV